MIPRFRAYDSGSLCRMYSPSEVMVGDSCIWILDEDSESNEWIVNNDLVLMQSTGLTDSVEKEIFEGDIVKVTDGDERTNFPDGGIGTICGLDEIFMWYIDGQVHNGLFDISQEYYIEVIGNIYENPEMLEVKS
nr:MAG TPA: YopX protein [Caudoviricetes sp.]